MNVKTKEYGKLSLKQLKEFYAHFHNFKNKQKEFDALTKEKAEQFSQLFELIPSWSSWYEIPWIKSLSFFFYITGIDTKVAKAEKSNDPHQAVLELLDNTETYEFDIDSISKEDSGVFFSLYFSFLGQINAISIFDRPMSVLLEQVRGGNDEALFCAILVDRNTISAPTISKRIQKAEFDNDNSFFDKLSKAVTRTKPRRPDKEFDDMRFIFQALEESIGLDKLTEKEIYELIVEDLELYPTDNLKDPFASLKKLIQRRKQSQGT